jgi:DNA-binding winged helix-turn-helix (wHTH) protein
MAHDFETFRIDFDSRQLFRGSEEVHLSPKAFQLLQKLIEIRPKAMSKAEIHELLWPATFVAESNLASIVNEVRRALDDDARSPKYIRTVHAFGYSFIAEPAAGHRKGNAVAKLIWDKGEEQLFPGRNIIGREGDASVIVDDRTISRHHAAIVLTGSVVLLEDLQSKNGTFLNGERVNGAIEIEDGANIEFGSVRMTFREISTASTETLFRK